MEVRGLQALATAGMAVLWPVPSQCRRGRRTASTLAATLCAWATLQVSCAAGSMDGLVGNGWGAGGGSDLQAGAGSRCAPGALDQQRTQEEAKRHCVDVGKWGAAPGLAPWHVGAAAGGHQT